jgi:hypothetical protein
MAKAESNLSTWRMYGGGGLLVGGFLWLVAVIVGNVASSTDTAFRWVELVGLIVVGLGFIVLAIGRSGSNGVVGKNLVGKIALWVAAFGFLVWGIWDIFTTSFPDTSKLPGVAQWIIAIAIFLGTVVAAAIIQLNGTARIIGKWALYAVALLALLFLLLPVFGITALDVWWVGFIFAIVTALTGLAYLLNPGAAGPVKPLTQ